MIHIFYDEFHHARLSNQHDKAMEIVTQINRKYYFNQKSIVTCLVNEDFKEEDCCKYIELHGGWLSVNKSV